MTTKRGRLAKLALALALLCGAVLVGCAAVSPLGGMGSLASVGIAPGGAQDIGLLRTLVESGEVPSPEALTLEGLYAGHDLPVEDAPPGKTLHLASATRRPSCQAARRPTSCRSACPAD